MSHSRRWGEEQKQKKRLHERRVCTRARIHSTFVTQQQQYCLVFSFHRQVKSLGTRERTVKIPYTSNNPQAPPHIIHLRYQPFPTERRLYYYVPTYFSIVHDSVVQQQQYGSLKIP